MYLHTNRYIYIHILIYLASISFYWSIHVLISVCSPISSYVQLCPLALGARSPRFWGHPGTLAKSSSFLRGPSRMMGNQCFYHWFRIKHVQISSSSEGKRLNMIVWLHHITVFQYYVYFLNVFEIRLAEKWTIDSFATSNGWFFSWSRPTRCPWRFIKRWWSRTLASHEFGYPGMNELWS